MDYEAIRNMLSENAMKLITMGGKIHPYGGAIIALLLGIGMIWLGIKVSKQMWAKRKKKAGEVIANTGKEQQSAKKTQDGIDDFLDDE